jgi:hypothetical protein
VFRRAPRPATALSEKPVRRRHHRRFFRRNEADAETGFECTPFGRRRKRALRPATLLTLGFLTAVGGVACWFLF